MFVQESFELYDNGKPVWAQYLLGVGNDLAAIPIILKSDVISTCVQDFSAGDTEALQPGMDVIIVGFPFEHGADMPFPVWKRAMVATEPAYTTFGQIQTLLDTPGTPGMSGSPVYRLSSGVSFAKDQYKQFREAQATGKTGLELIRALDFSSMAPGRVLSLVGVYAGSTCSPGLEKLSLGRMMFAATIDMLTMQGEPGMNPFPPERFENS